MINIEEPINYVLKDFCHVEWYDIAALAKLIQSGGAKFDSNLLQHQFESLLSTPFKITSPINELTANEFESEEETRKWLQEIYKKAFSCETIDRRSP